MLYFLMIGDRMPAIFLTYFPIGKLRNPYLLGLCRLLFVSLIIPPLLFGFLPPPPPIQLGDTGRYTCIASTPSGEASWSAYIEVQGK